MPAVVWKGFVSFGLVSFPVRLMAAARNKPLRFHLLHKKDSSRVKEVFYCREEDKPVQREDLVKGFEVSKDEYVVVTDEELKKIAPKTAKVMDILQFVKAEEFDPVFLDKSYHMLPDGEIVKPYALLLQAMQKREQYAVAKVAMHNREHIVVLRPSGNELMLHTLFFANEVQRVDVKVGPAKFSGKELQLASQLIDMLSGKFQPEKFQDAYQKNVEQLIEQKQKGERVHAPKYERPRPVVDILKALQQSLAKSKATPEQAAAPARPRKHKAA
jgi:DNA end-binding protein Ku